MIAAWMLGAMLFGSFAALAGRCAETVLRATHRPARIAWSVALAAAVLWPVLLPVVEQASPQASAAVLPVIHVAPLMPASTDRSPGGWLDGLDAALAVLWGVASALLLVRLGATVRRTRQIRARAERSQGTSHDFLISDDVGPALVGVVHPEIIYPRTLLTLEPALRDLIVRHEQEHRRAHDAWLAFGCALGVMLMPWNPALWWISRRARLALEIDCDARVLRAGVSRERYGRLLLLVAQTDVVSPLVPALISSRSHLERRIGTMMNPQRSNRRVRIAAGSAGLLLSIAAACSARVAAGAGPESPSGARAGLVPVTVKQVDAATGRLSLKPDAALSSSDIRAIARTLASDTTLRDSLARTSNVGHRSSATLRDSLPRTPHVEFKSDTTGRDSMARKPYFEFKIEKQAQLIQGSYFIKYPEELRAAPIAGEVLVQLVVDDKGAMLPGSLKVIRATNAAFARSVREAMETARFTPAEVDGRKVRQLIQLPFDLPIPPTR